jgi:hypothetical protein
MKAFYFRTAPPSAVAIIQNVYILVVLLIEIFLIKNCCFPSDIEINDGFAEFEDDIAI